jgi:hypothetical protein
VISGQISNHISAHRTAKQTHAVTDKHPHDPSTQAVVEGQTTDNSYDLQRFRAPDSVSAIIHTVAPTLNAASVSMISTRFHARLEIESFCTSVVEGQGRLRNAPTMATMGVGQQRAPGYLPPGTCQRVARRLDWALPQAALRRRPVGSAFASPGRTNRADWVIWATARLPRRTWV